MYDFRFYQACMGQTQLVCKVEWGYSGVGFIGENVGRAKGLRYLIFSLFHGFAFYYGISMGIKMDNSIILK